MGREGLLDVEPRELTFRYELNKQAFCTIQLSNNSSHCVAYRILNSANRNSEQVKYFVNGPEVGFLLPRSNCNVQVSLLAPEEYPSDEECKDQFLVWSIATRPGTTTEGALRMFEEKRREDDIRGCMLRVVYFYPPQRQSSNSERFQAGSSNLDSESQSSNSERSHEGSSNLDDSQITQQQDGNGFHFSDLFMIGIASGFLGLIFWFLMLPLIWWFAFMIVMLVRKMINKPLETSLEEWVVSTLACMSGNLISVLWEQVKKEPKRE